jgi:hypothetical protein
VQFQTGAGTEEGRFEQVLHIVGADPADVVGERSALAPAG